MIGNKGRLSGVTCVYSWVLISTDCLSWSSSPLTSIDRLVVKLGDVVCGNVSKVLVFHLFLCFHVAHSAEYPDSGHTMSRCDCARVPHGCDYSGMSCVSCSMNAQYIYSPSY